MAKVISPRAHVFAILLLAAFVSGDAAHAEPPAPQASSPAINTERPSLRSEALSVSLLRIQKPTDASNRVERREVYRVAAPRQIRSEAVIEVGDALHLFVLSSEGEVPGRKPALAHLITGDRARSWSAPEMIPEPLEEDATWIRVFERKGGLSLLVGSEGPRRVAAELSIVDLSADGRSFLGKHSLTLAPPSGELPYRTHPTTCQMIGSENDRSLLCSAFTFRDGKRRSAVYRSHTNDGGKSWTTPALLRPELSEAPLLRPAAYVGKESSVVFWGDPSTKRLLRLNLGPRSLGENFEASDAGNINDINALTTVYSGFQLGRRWILADHQRTPKRQTFGLCEYESTDEGRQWSVSRIVDLGMQQPYALFGINGTGQAGFASRGYIIPGVGFGVATFDDGASWQKARFPEELSQGALLISPRAGFIVLGHDQLSASLAVLPPP